MKIGVDNINLHITQITENDMNDIICLFDKDFYFLTSYPELVSFEEIKIYFLMGGKTYKIMNNNEIIGLGFLIPFTPQYIFFKLRIKLDKCENQSTEMLLGQFIKFVKDNYENVKRLETTVYEFDKDEIEVLNNCGMRCEVFKQDEIFKDDRFWGSYLYSLIEDEIDKLISNQHICGVEA